MIIIELLMYFIFGAVIGSFLNVCISRLPEEKSLAYPPSHCPHCQHPLAWNDLFPLISFLMLKGQCRYCKRTIRPRYFFVELLTGLMFAGAAFFIPDLAPRISFIILTANLIVILFADLETYIIPDELVLFGLSWAGITAFYNGELILGLLAAAVGAGFLFAVRIFGQMVYKKEALGFGDVKLGAMMGLYLGIPGIINGLFIGYILGALISLVLIVLKLKKSTDLIPFGPFLVAGTFLVMLNPQLWQRLLLPWW